MSRPLVALALALFALAPASVRPATAQPNQDTPMVRIGTLGGVFSTLWAVNNDNAAVGWSDVTYTDSGARHPVAGRTADRSRYPAR